MDFGSQRPRICELCKCIDHTTERLDEAAYNVDFGAGYLAQLARDVDIDVSGHLDSDQVGRLAAAYNAGPTVARAHFERGEPLPAETARYVAAMQTLWDAHVEAHES